MGFTFDSPISSTYSAYDKANKHSQRGTPLPSSKTKRKSISSPTSLFASIRNSFGRSNSLSSPPAQVLNTNAQKASSASESPLFALPLNVREKIYSYVVGDGEVFHILLKRKASRSTYAIGFRICRAGGNRDDCIISNCKQFCDVVNGVYFGSFDSVGGLLLACRDIYKEASQIFYTQNTFSFDAPLSLLLFIQQVSSPCLQSINSISIDLGKYLHDPKSGIRCKSFHSSQWVGCWELLARMEGLKEIRVRFRSPAEGWMGWSEKEVLEPLFLVSGPLKVFEVEALSTAEAAFDDNENENRVPFTLVRDVQVPRR